MSEETKPNGAKASSSPNAVEQEYINFTEKTVQESAYHSDSQSKPYNTDLLYLKHCDYSTHEEMLIDDQISVCAQLKKDITLGSGSSIVASESDQDEIVEDLEKAIYEDPDVPLENMLEEVISAYDFGFSLSEKMFQRRDNLSIALKILKTRHPDTWLIWTDEKGNIEKYEQIGVRNSIAIDPKTLIHYVNKGRFQNPYGQPDLTPAYLPWFAKKQFIKYFAIFAEKSASPIPVGKYPKNMKETEKSALLNILKKFQSKTALVFSKEMEIDFLEAKSKGEFYEKGINMFNMFIGRALFVPDLLGLQGGETAGGAYALGKEQIEIFFRHIRRRRTYIEWLVNKHIIKPIVLNNWGRIDKPPKWKLNPITEDDVLEAAKIWVDAVKGRVFKPNDEEINKFRNIVNFPEGDVIKPEPIVHPSTENPDDPEDDKDPKDEENLDGDNNEEKKDEVTPKGGEDSKDIEVDDNGKDSDMEKDKKNFAYKTPSGDFHKKVDFKVIERSLDSGKDRIMAEVAPIVKFIFDDLSEQIDKKKIVDRNRIDKIETLKIRKMKDLKTIIKSNLRRNFVDAKNQAATEIFKSNFKAPLPSQEFLDVLDQEVFDYVGDWAYKVNQGARTEIIAAIKDGRPLSSVIDMLTNQGVKDSLISLERFARTKLTETMNRGRQEFFESSGAVTGYQFSAIMDDRTSPVCSGLHGKKFKAGTEPTPPLHFNCRSLLIPITYLEEFKPTEEISGLSPDAFIDANIGKGFSKS